MIVEVDRKGNKWYATIKEDGVLLVESHSGEFKVGCAVRQVLNKMQMMHGVPSDSKVTLTIDDW